MKERHLEAEEITDRLCASALAGALDEERYSDFEAGVAALRSATRRSPPEPLPRRGRSPTARVKGCSTAGLVPTEECVNSHGPVVQLGVHAALSRRRSRVQIPSGPPTEL